MNNELDFLFQSKLTNYNNLDTIYGNLVANKVKLQKNTKGATTSAVKTVNLFMTPQSEGTKGVRNMIKEKVYNNDENHNPYLKLIKDFSTNKALRLSAADFAYLKDLGVYPLNRLIVLRRFPEGVIPPVNLSAWKNSVSPLATVVSWVKEGNDELFNISFNEDWTTTKSMLHEVLGDILKNEFGLGGDQVMSVPGWSQGLLFGFLKAMKLTGDEYGFNSIPVGDPNVLKEAAIREGGGPEVAYSLKSQFNYNFDVTYEQKFIGDIDPGMAMNDILNNLIKIGTSNVKYIFAGVDKSPIIQALNDANNAGNNADLWWKFITVCIDAFLEAIVTLIDSVGKQFDAPTGKTNTSTGSTEGGVTSKAMGAMKETANKLASGIKNLGDGLIKTVLTSTVAKYKWPLKGSIGVMTGQATTPWHITIGNPYFPVLSMNNVLVTSVAVSQPTEFGFNDKPTHLTAKISVTQGRNLGGNEISKYFNNGYTRTYSSKTSIPVSLDDGTVDNNRIMSKPQDVSKMNRDNQLDTNTFSESFNSTDNNSIT